MRLSYKDCGKIGFTCSTFDLLHAGHITMLEEAKRNCDFLIVGLQTDPTIAVSYTHLTLPTICSV